MNKDGDHKPADEGEDMDVRGGRDHVPAPRRLHGADRSGLGERGAAEVPEDRIGPPHDTNISDEKTIPK